MQTKPKSNSVITSSVAGQLIVFNVKGVGAIEFDTAKVHADVFTRAAMHGFIQRVSDAAAISRNPDTGLPASPKDKYEAMKAIVDHYMTGTEEWSRRRAGGGEGRDSGGLVVQALARVYGNTVAEAEATIARTMEKKGLDRKAALKLWAGTDKVTAAVAEIKAERAAAAAKTASVDADDLLNELEE